MHWCLRFHTCCTFVKASSNTCANKDIFKYSLRRRSITCRKCQRWIWTTHDGESEQRSFASSGSVVVSSSREKVASSQWLADDEGCGQKLNMNSGLSSRWSWISYLWHNGDYLTSQQPGRFLTSNAGRTIFAYRYINFLPGLLKPGTENRITKKNNWRDQSMTLPNGFSV